MSEIPRPVNFPSLCPDALARLAYPRATRPNPTTTHEGSHDTVQTRVHGRPRGALSPSLTQPTGSTAANNFFPENRVYNICFFPHPNPHGPPGLSVVYCERRLIARRNRLRLFRGLRKQHASARTFYLQTCRVHGLNPTKSTMHNRRHKNYAIILKNQHFFPVLWK